MHQAPQPPHDGLRPGLRKPAAGSASAPARPGPQRLPLALHAGRASSARIKGEARAFLRTDRDARARGDGREEGRARAGRWTGGACARVQRQTRGACTRVGEPARGPEYSLALPLRTSPPEDSATRYSNPD